MEGLNYEPTPEELAFLFPREYWEEGKAPANAVSIFDVPVSALEDPIDRNYWRNLKRLVSKDREIIINKIAEIRAAIDNELQLTQEQADLIVVAGLRRLERADFSGLDLVAADLTCAKLIGAKFFYTGLSMAHLSGADNAGAKFQYAKADEAFFEGATNDGADFSYAKLDKAHFEDSANRRTKFFLANLTDADFKNTDNRGANFECAMITRTDFEGANNEGASFIFANKMD